MKLLTLCALASCLSLLSFASRAASAAITGEPTPSNVTAALATRLSVAAGAPVVCTPLAAPGDAAAVVCALEEEESAAVAHAAAPRVSVFTVFFRTEDALVRIGVARCDACAR